MGTKAKTPGVTAPGVFYSVFLQGGLIPWAGYRYLSPSNHLQM